jgi:SAM-dependent methyltransferase
MDQATDLLRDICRAYQGMEFAPMYVHRARTLLDDAGVLERGSPAVQRLVQMYAQRHGRVKVDVGCGLWPRGEDFITVDRHAGDLVKVPGPVPQADGTVVQGLVETPLKADVRSDMWDLPFEDGSVDEIWCSHALEHVPMAKVIETLKEFARVLRPGAQREARHRHRRRRQDRRRHRRAPGGGVRRRAARPRRARAHQPRAHPALLRALRARRPPRQRRRQLRRGRARARRVARRLAPRARDQRGRRLRLLPPRARAHAGGRAHRQHRRRRRGPMESRSGYAAAKSALWRLTETLAAEEPALRVNAIAPGPMDSRMQDAGRRRPAEWAEFMRRMREGQGGDVPVENTLRVLDHILTARPTGQLFFAREFSARPALVSSR